MKAFHSEFKRSYKTIRAEIHLNTKNNEGRKIKFDFDYYCLPYIIRNLRKVWKEERARRLEDITAIDNEVRPNE